MSIEDIIEHRGLHSQGRHDEFEFGFRFRILGRSRVPGWFRFLSSLSRLELSHRNTSYGLIWSGEDTDNIWMLFRRFQFEWKHYYGFRRNLDIDMDTSDKITLETLRQREQRQGQHGEDTVKGPGGGRGKGRTRRLAERSPSPAARSVDTVVTRLRTDDGDSDVRGGGGPGPGPERGDGTPMHLVVGDLLSLVEDLVRFGKQCDRLHDAVQKPPRRGSGGGGTGTGTSTSRQNQATVRDLTFEVFAAVARLAVALSMGSSFPSPEQTVLLLTTVRLPRITKLAAACEQQMMDDGMARPASSPAANANTGQLVDDVAAAVVDRLKGLLDKQAAQIRTEVAQLEQRLPRTRLDGGSSSNASGAVVPVVSAANGDSITYGLNGFSSSSEFQDQIRDAVRHEVKLQIHGIETASLPENGQSRGSWLSFLRGN